MLVAVFDFDYRHGASFYRPTFSELFVSTVLLLQPQARERSAPWGHYICAVFTCVSTKRKTHLFRQSYPDIVL